MRGTLVFQAFGSVMPKVDRDALQQKSLEKSSPLKPNKQLHDHVRSGHSTELLIQHGSDTIGVENHYKPWLPLMSPLCPPYTPPPPPSYSLYPRNPKP